MPATWALSARPVPVTAAFTSLGVCHATGSPASAAARTAAADAWAVPITVCRLCWLNIRSMATTSGRQLLDELLDAPADHEQPLGQGIGGGRGDHLDMPKGQRPAERALDEAHPTAGQARIHPEYAHVTSRYEQVFAPYREAGPATVTTRVRSAGTAPVDRRSRGGYSPATGSLACTGWPTTSANPARMHSTNSSRSGMAASSIEIPIPALPA